MAELKLYNTLTRAKDDLKPLAINPETGRPLVRMYVCGPTVYDFAHIGNARPVIVFDVLFRLLRHLYGPENVIYTRNITDVDDKINDRAARDFPDLPLNEAIRKVTEATAAQFQADVKALGCLEPTHQPRATEHIPQMIEIIGRLLANGCAYIAEGAGGREVLFSVETMPRYGQLSNRKLEEQREGARIAVEAHKKSPGDFVLWKESSAHEPGWNADFTSGTETVTIYGRPGWHIECSAMSMAKLLEPFGGGLACDDPAKNTFDIHGGGIDLVFPHHENEIAQSCCAFGKPGEPNARMANIWMHNGFLQVEGQKMSKSLGNFVTIRELMRGWRGQPWAGAVLRWSMLQTNYRQPIDWTEASLLDSRDELDAIFRMAGLREKKKISSRNYLDHITKNFEPSQKLIEALSDDLNTPEAVAWIRHLKGRMYDDEQILDQLMRDLVFIGVVGAETRFLFSWFSFGYALAGAEAKIVRDAILDARIAQANGDLEFLNELKDKSKSVGVELRVSNPYDFGWSIPERKSIDELIDARLAARNAKNFAESDRIRDELVAMGIQIMDSKDSITGELKTTWEVKR